MKSYDTAAFSGPIVLADDKDKCTRNFSNMMISRRIPKYSEINYAPIPLCPPQIPNGLVWD
jgi:hypothetical protein